jgi:8-oxo-dGTP diphosphatase
LTSGRSAPTIRRVPFTYEYPRPAVTVDVVLFTMRAEDLAVLLVKRRAAPFKDHWALPGGFVNPHERLEQAAARELAEETSVTGVSLDQLGAFGDPGRDPRGHTVSVAYLAFVIAESHALEAGDDAAEASWVKLHDLVLGGRKKRGAKALAFDHAKILEVARERLQERLHDPRRHGAFDLVPPRFTLAELQRVYEAVYGQAFDARAFRKRALEEFVVPAGAPKRKTQRAHQQLFRWKPAR